MIVYLFEPGATPEDPRRFSVNLNNLHRDMIKYLKHQHGADDTDAMDAAQETLYVLLKMWKNNELQEVKAHKAYVFKILRNQYLKILRDRSMYAREPIESYLEKMVYHQIDEYIERENNVLLSECISKLSAKHQDYINYWLFELNPSTMEFSDLFGISASNAWTIKHRLITILKKCVLQKLDGFVELPVPKNRRNTN